METRGNQKDWTKLRGGFVRHLESVGYGSRTLIRYRGALNRLERYMRDRKEEEYSHQTGAVFLKTVEESVGRHTIVLYRTVIRRLGDFLDGVYRYKSKRPQSGLSVPSKFQNHLDDYLAYMRLHGRREPTIENHSYYCARALCAFDGLGIQRLSSIMPQDIYSAFAVCSSKTNWSNACKCFLKFLSKTGVTDDDMSVYVPSVRRPQLLPSVYSREETDRLLAAIDRSSELGKRNYAMVLLALRLGLRVGDIVGLRLENVNFHAKSIEFIQQKTRNPQRLEMPSDVEAALTLYLSSRRPAIDCGSLFTSVLPPFGKITRETVGKFVHRFFKAADICTDGKKYGTHSLRMTLASELVTENVPYAVVGKILGHEDPNSTGAYVKFDIESLRKCALEVPPPSGLLGEMLGFHEGRCE